MRESTERALNYSERARPLIQSRMCHQGENIRAPACSPWPLVSVTRPVRSLATRISKSEVDGS